MIISEKKYFEQYENVIGKNIDSLIQEFIFINTNTDLHYHTQVSAVFSSNIEGNTIDLNSFMNYSLS